MSVWNVFKMELFKNANDRINLAVMLVLTVLNTLGAATNIINNWRSPFWVPMWMIWLASAAFLVIYPYQLARIDYKNKVMSLLIASGVSRVQYYFVKIGATFLFSLLSFLMVVALPVIVMDFSVLPDFFRMVFSDDFPFLITAFLGWLSVFFTLMTAVILCRGKGYTIFVFGGMYLVTTYFWMLLGGLLNEVGLEFGSFFITSFLTMIVMGTIGIAILRKQDL